MQRAIALVFCLLIMTSAATAELQQTLTRTGMQVMLMPGSSQAEVSEICDIDYRRGLNSITICHTGAKVVADTMTLLPPDGLDVVRTARPPGKADTVVWEVDGGAGTTQPTEVRYTLDGIKWKLVYRMDYAPSSTDPMQGTVALCADVEVTNESGMDLTDCALSIQIGARDEVETLTVGTDTVDVPAGWTRRWNASMADGGRGIIEGLPARISYVYDPLTFKGSVHKLLLLSRPDDEATLLRALKLPQSAMDIYLPTDGVEAELPSVSATWQPTAGTGEDVEGPWLEIDAGAEASIVVESRLMGLKIDKLNLDKTGRVAGYDIIEARRIEITNYTGSAVAFAAYQEVASKWVLSGIKPELGEAPPAARGAAKPIWFGELEAGEPTTVEFTVTKHQGTNT